MTDKFVHVHTGKHDDTITHEQTVWIVSSQVGVRISRDKDHTRYEQKYERSYLSTLYTQHLFEYIILHVHTLLCTCAHTTVYMCTHHCVHVHTPLCTCAHTTVYMCTHYCVHVEYMQTYNSRSVNTRWLS